MLAGTTMASGGETRIKSYKAKRLDVVELRKRREEEGVQLRKLRREEQLSKRRNLQEHELAERAELQHFFTDDTPLDVLAKALHSADSKEQLAATSKFRKLLSAFGQNPPITEVINTGCMPKFVEFLSMDSNPMLQFEATWVLTNVASGSSLQTRAVIQVGAIPSLVQLLLSPHEHIKEQAVWALGNIAGDSPECRDIVLSHGIMDALIVILKDGELSDSALRNVVWTISNLCRGKKPPPDTSQVYKCIPALAKLLYSDDPETLSHCCWSVSFFADGPNDKIQKIIDGGITRRLVELLMHPDRKVVPPALRAVGNMLTGDDVQTQVLLNCSVLPALLHLLSSQFEMVKKEACWALSNVTAGNRVQIQAVIDCNLFPVLIDVMNSAAEYKTRKEAAWAVLNATSGGTEQQIRYLVSIGCIKPVCDLLTVQDVRLVLITLEGLENILKVGQADVAKNGGVNPYSVLVEEAYGLDKIEYLQNHTSQEVYRLAYRIIEKYFSDEEEVDSSIEPSRSNDGEQFIFSHSSVPEEGFQL